jgi:uncharacterized protein (TIGR02246 family)
MSAALFTSLEQDIAAIRQLVADAEDTQSDTERFTQLLTPDFVIVNIAGRRLIGRDQVRQAMAKAMETHLANVLTRYELVDITFIRPDVAIVSCIKHISDQNENSDDALPSKGSFTLVVTRELDGWRIALAQTTGIAS